MSQDNSGRDSDGAQRDDQQLATDGGTKQSVAHSESADLEATSDEPTMFVDGELNWLAVCPFCGTKRLSHSKIMSHAKTHLPDTDGHLDPIHTLQELAEIAEERGCDYVGDLPESDQ